MSIAGAPSPKHYSVRDLKSKILDRQLAQTSVYLVNVTSVNQDIKNFMEARGIGLDINLQESINLFCADASLPGTTLATHEVTNDYSGVTEKMAYRRIYDDTIDLTFYIDGQYKLLSYFDYWMDYITGQGTTLTSAQYESRNAIYRMNYPIVYKTNIYITKFEKLYNQSQPALKYKFLDAFPINIVSIPISYEASDLLKCTVSFAYTRYLRTTGFFQVSDYRPPVNPATQAQANAAANSPGNPEIRNNVPRGDGFTNTPGGGTGTPTGSDGFFNTPGGGTGTSTGSDGFFDIPGGIRSEPLF